MPRMVRMLGVKTPAKVPRVPWGVVGACGRHGVVTHRLCVMRSARIQMANRNWSHMISTTWNQYSQEPVGLRMILLGNCSMRRLKRLLLVLYLLHGPGRFLDRFRVSPSGPGQPLDRYPVSPSGPGQPLDRYPVSPSPCSRAAVGVRPIAPLAALSPDFSLRRITMRLEIMTICSRSPTRLATNP